MIRLGRLSVTHAGNSLFASLHQIGVVWNYDQSLFSTKKKFFMTVRKSISFSDQHDAWMKAQLASGQYTSESEIIRDLIRHARRREDEVERIRDALRAGEESGATCVTPDEIRQNVLERLRKDGRL